jgi:hypothetical protein
VRNAAEPRKMLAQLAGEARAKGIGASGAMSQRAAYAESAVVNELGIMLLMRNCAERLGMLSILKACSNSIRI